MENFLFNVEGAHFVLEDVQFNFKNAKIAWKSVQCDTRKY